jgi:signal transduction histidine kinase/HAMP domain-containing protein
MKYFISLRTKVLTGVVLLIVMMSILSLALIQISVPEKIESEILKRAIFLSHDIAYESTEYILQEQLLELELNLYRNLRIAPGAEYIFIQDADGDVIAHTFGDSFPVNLVDVNSASQGQPYNIQHIKNKDNRIIDIAMPLLDGELGTVRLGMSAMPIIKGISDVTGTVVAVVVGVLILGGVAAMILADRVTRPISALIGAINNITAGRFENIVTVDSRDEIGQLATTFNQMVNRLKATTVHRDKLISEIEERVEIAKKLHESKQDWENTFNTLTDMITVHDKDFNIIRSNNEAKKILDLPMFTEMPKIKKGDVKCFKRYHGTDAPPEGCPSCDCLKTGEPASFELYEPHLGKHIEIRAIPRFDEDQNIIGLVHVVRDISQRVEAQRQIEKSREELRLLNSYLQNLREEERTRIAHEIHDELGQSLTALKIEVSWLAKKLGSRDRIMKDKLADIEAITESTIHAMRKIAYELRPGVLDDIGLQAALELQVEDFRKHTGIECDITLDKEIDRLEHQLSTAVFRIIQETLTNVARHSEATKVSGFVHLSNGSVSAQITDNGVGFSEEDVSRKVHLGIAGMKERARQMGGEVTVEGVPNEGTKVSVQMPFST